MLKAIGAGNRRLAGLVLAQAILLAVFGFLAGLLITGAAGLIIGAAVPEMTLYFTPAALPPGFLASIGVRMDALRAAGLTKTYGEGDAAVRAVDAASLALRAGEVTLIMGPSGSGKTTLLFLLGGLLHPTPGHVWGN